MNNIIEVGFIDKGNGKHQSNVVYGHDGISPTLCAGIGVKYWVHILDKGENMEKYAIRMVRTDEAKRLRKAYEAHEIHHGFNEYRKPELRTDGISNTVSTVLKDNYITEINMENTNTYKIRKLTPKECWRLMAFEDEDFEKAQAAGISNTQLYKQAGNSIVVDVLYHIYKNLYAAMPYLFEDLKVSSFFSGVGAFEKGLDKLYEDINAENFQ